MERTDLPVEAFLKGPFLAFIQELVGSKRAFIARLLIAEGHKHPELTNFYYEQVVSRGIETITRLIDRGIERGEFKPTKLRDYPQLLIAPVLTAIIWRGLFERHCRLDTDGLLRTNIELLTDAIRAPGRDPVPIRGRAMKRKALLIVAALSAIAVAVALFTFPANEETEFPGYMEADFVLVGSEQAGRIASSPSTKARMSNRAIRSSRWKARSRKLRSKRRAPACRKPMPGSPT